MGRESSVEYKDDKVKRTFATFYTQLAERRFNETVSKSRRPEDLLLIFYSSATKEFQKEKPGQDAEWKSLVDRQVALFVRLMSTVLKEQGWSSSHPELSTRLATLEKSLLRHDGNLTDESAAAGPGRMILGPSEPLSYDVKDMPLVQIVSRVFNVPLDVCQDDINRNKTVWTDKAALQDMKAYNNNLNLQTKRALRAEDFETNEGFEEWKKKETPALSKVMLAIIQSNPEELTKSTASAPPPTTRRPGHSHSMSTYQTSSHQSNPNGRYSMGAAPTLRMVGESTDVANVMASESTSEDDDIAYVYIPPDPRIYFRHILDRCLTYDMGDPNLPPLDVPNATGPVHLLSKDSLKLLDECQLRWRVPQFTRMVLVLDCIRTKYQQEDVDLATLDGAFCYFKQEVGAPWQHWTIMDMDLFRQILTQTHSAVLRELYEILQHAFDPKAIPIGRAMWVLDHHIYTEELFSTNELEQFMEHLEDGLRSKAEEVLLGFLQTLPHERENLDPLHVVELTQKVIKLAERLSKRFKEPILGYAEADVLCGTVAKVSTERLTL